MQQSRWFGKRDTAELQASGAEGYLPNSDTSRAAALTPSPAAESRPDLPEARSEAQILLAERRLWSEQVARFDPDPRHLARSLVTGAGAPNDIRAAYNIVRTETLRRLRENGWNTVGITSPSRGSGSTVTAINLAISMARDFHQTVLLVELDLIAPSFHRIFGFGRRLGISDYLLHNTPLAEVVLDIGIDRLAIVPAGSPVDNSSELLSSPRMVEFVDQLRQCYGRVVVLFDLPAALAADDAMAFASLVDCMLLVVEENETRVEEVKRATAHLGKKKVLGVVLNRAARADTSAAPSRARG